MAGSIYSTHMAVAMAITESIHFPSGSESVCDMNNAMCEKWNHLSQSYRPCGMCRLL